MKVFSLLSESAGVNARVYIPHVHIMQSAHVSGKIHVNYFLKLGNNT